MELSANYIQELAFQSLILAAAPIHRDSRALEGAALDRVLHPFSLRAFPFRSVVTLHSAVHAQLHRPFPLPAKRQQSLIHKKHVVPYISVLPLRDRRPSYCADLDDL